MDGVVREVAYRALAEKLRTAIRRGDFGDGQALPTEEQLAADERLSRSTVRRAMQDLVADGVIYRVAGRGTFPVAQGERYLRHFGSVEDLMALSSDTDCEVLLPLRRRQDPVAASRLLVEPGAVMSLTLRRLYGDVPFCWTSVTVPTEIGKLLARNRFVRTAGARGNVTVIGLLDTETPISVSDADQSVTAVAAPADAAAQLACPEGAPVLRIERLYSDADGRPVEWAVSYFHPDFYTYRVRLRRRLP